MTAPAKPTSPSANSTPAKGGSEQTLPFDEDLFDILVDPQSKSPLKFVEGSLISTDKSSRRVYRIENGIPVLAVDMSHQLSEADWEMIIAMPGRVTAGPEAVRKRMDANKAKQQPKA